MQPRQAVCCGRGCRLQALVSEDWLVLLAVWRRELREGGPISSWPSAPRPTGLRTSLFEMAFDYVGISLDSEKAARKEIKIIS